MSQSQTLTQAFLASVKANGDRPALSTKVDGTWKSQSYAEYGQRARQVACALVELGTAFGERVAIIAENRPEWVIADQGILMAGAVTVPLYPTLTAVQTAYILNDCGAKLAIVASEAQLAKLQSVKAELTHLTHLVVMNDFSIPADHGQVYKLTDLFALGERCESNHGGELDQRIAGQTPDSLATIVYTSGTTGEPKGAMLTHGNMMSNCGPLTPVFGISSKDVALSFLPLSHVLERQANFCMVLGGAHVYFAESVEAVPTNMMEVRPTLLASVPRLFEKIKARVLDKVAQDSHLKQGIFKWASAIGNEYLDAKQAKAPVNLGLALRHQAADGLVFSKIRERTGGRLRLCISGGAPLAADVGKFFGMLGIEIVEGYGLTETSPVICINRPGDVKFGTVGRAIKDVEIKLAEDGELLSRGPHIMKGYFNLPEQTAQAIDADGWFHTGDIAEIDADGRIRIVDRKKEIIVMSNGKNVAPQPIENALKSSNLIEMAMCIGDHRNFITALLVPNYEALKVFATEHKLDGLATGDLLKHSQVQALYKREVDTACATFARYEQVKKFVLLPEAFDPARNELTPTLKVKRRVITEHYEGEIEGMYATETVSA